MRENRFWRAIFLLKSRMSTRFFNDSYLWCFRKKKKTVNFRNCTWNKREFDLLTSLEISIFPLLLSTWLHTISGVFFSFRPKQRPKLTFGGYCACWNRKLNSTTTFESVHLEKSCNLLFNKSHFLNPLLNQVKSIVSFKTQYKNFIQTTLLGRSYITLTFLYFPNFFHIASY